MRYLAITWLTVLYQLFAAFRQIQTTKADIIIQVNDFNPVFSAHDKKIKKSDKTRHNSNFFDELNHAKSYQT